MIEMPEDEANSDALPSIPLPRLYERDIDVLLREELLFGAPVQKLVLSALNLPATARFVHCRLSVVDATGETDVVADLIVEGRAVSILIENKIDASFQPRQPERYRERVDALEPESAYCLLVAPNGYVAKTSAALSFFDAMLSYEDLASAIASEATPRAVDRANLLTRAVSQARAAYAVVPNAVVGTLWARVFDIASSEFPQLQMKAPSEKGSNSSWIIFKANLPPRVTVDWKLPSGTVGLSFWQSARIRPDETTDLTSLGGRAQWRIAGTTAIIEVNLGMQRKDSWAELHDDEIRSALSAANDLVAFHDRFLSA